MLTKKENETTTEYLERIDIEFKKSSDNLVNVILKNRIIELLSLIDTGEVELGELNGQKLNAIDMGIITTMLEANQIVDLDLDEKNQSDFIINYVYEKLKK